MQVPNIEFDYAGPSCSTRMTVCASNKRGATALANVEVVVLELECGGWAHCRRCDTGTIVKLPQKCLAPLAGGVLGTPRKSTHRKRSSDQMGSPFAALELQDFMQEGGQRNNITVKSKPCTKFCQ